MVSKYLLQHRLIKWHVRRDKFIYTFQVEKYLNFASSSIVEYRSVKEEFLNSFGSRVLLSEYQYDGVLFDDDNYFFDNFNKN